MPSDASPTKRGSKRAAAPKFLYVVPAPRIQLGGGSSTSGPARHIRGVVAALERRGVVVDLWLSSDRWYARRAKTASEASLRGSPRRVALQDLVRLLVGLANVMSIALRPTPGVIYERLATMQCVGLLHKLRGALWIVESNGLFFLEANVERRSLQLVRAARMLELMCYRRADLIVTVSDALKEQILEVSGVAPDKILVMRNAVDPAVFDGRPPARDTASATAQIGFVGTLVEWQRVDRLIHALAGEPLLGRCVELHVVGDGPAQPELEQLARRLGVAVVFHGRREAEAIPALIAQFAVAYCGHELSTGANYHSPLKLYEYAACGVPVVSTHSEDAELLAQEFPILMLSPGWTTGDLTRKLVEAISLPRPKPLVVAYDDRLEPLMTRLAAVRAS